MIFQAKGFFGKISKALLATQSTKSLAEASTKQNSDTSPRSSGVVKSPSKASASLSNLASGRESLSKRSNEQLAKSSLKSKSKEGKDKRGLGSGDSLTPSVTSVSGTKSSQDFSAVASVPSSSTGKGNAAYEAIKLYNEQQVANKNVILTTVGSPSSRKGEIRPAALSIKNPNSSSTSPPASAAISDKDAAKEAWPSGQPGSFSAKTRPQKATSTELLDDDSASQKRKDSTASQSTTNAMSSSMRQAATLAKTPSIDAKAAEALMAQLRSTAGLKVTSSSQQTMIDSRSMSGLAMGGAVDAATAATRARGTSVSQAAAAVAARKENHTSLTNAGFNSTNGNPSSTAAPAASRKESLNLTSSPLAGAQASRKDSTGNNVAGTGRKDQQKYNAITGTIEEFPGDSSTAGGQPRVAGRARGTTLSNTQAVKSPFGGAQVAAAQQAAANSPFGGPAASPFQTGPGAPAGRARKGTVGSQSDQPASSPLSFEQRIAGGSHRRQTSQLGSEVEEEGEEDNDKSSYKAKALKTIYNTSSHEAYKGDIADFGFDQDSIFAVKGNIHLVQCFPNGGSPFTLNTGWEVEGMRIDCWHSVC